MEQTLDNIEVVAVHIVENMNKEELKQYVFEDLCGLMIGAQECFEANVTEFKRSRDVNNDNTKRV